MAAKRPNPRLAKIHRSYTVDEIAALYGVHRNTVRNWIKHGLSTIDQRRPQLVLGSHLADFLCTRRASSKRPCTPSEIYCLRCREPRVPVGRAVRYLPASTTHGNLVGQCEDCGAKLYRRINVAQLPLFLTVLVVTRTDAEPHIDESPKPSLNSDFAEDVQNHVKTSP